MRAKWYVPGFKPLTVNSSFSPAFFGAGSPATFSAAQKEHSPPPLASSTMAMSDHLTW